MMSHELEALGIVPDDIVGIFEQERLEEILDFCRRNPEIHIVSKMEDGTFLNYAANGADHYALADGNANPRLVAKDIRFLRGVAIVKQFAAFSKP